VTGRLIRITTALAVVAVAGVAAIISYRDAYELVTSHGESGLTARLLPFTVDGLIWAASMAGLDASRRNHRVPRLTAWSLAAGIVAAVGANVAHGVNHGPRCPGQRMARPGTGRLIRAAHAAHQIRSPSQRCPLHRHRIQPAGASSAPRCTTIGRACGAGGASSARGRPQPAGDSPRT
jgi:hypothetical protein